MTEAARPSSRSRPRRADAQRNYQRLLDEARTTFAEHGVDASLDEIARRAGVASGTLYRHFPTRSDLVEAVLAEQIAEQVELGRGLLTAENELDALADWLRAVLRHGLTYRGLSAEMMNSALDRDHELVSAWHAELFTVGAALVARARDAGEVVDADPADVLRMVGAIAGSVQGIADGDAQAERMFALLVNGLRQR